MNSSRTLPTQMSGIYSFQNKVFRENTHRQFIGFGRKLREHDLNIIKVFQIFRLIFTIIIQRQFNTYIRFSFHKTTN